MTTGNNLSTGILKSNEMGMGMGNNLPDSKRLFINTI